MRLSTQSRFAVTAMVDIGLHQVAGPVSLACVSQRQQISLSYLEQIFKKLRQHGLTESTRGPGGGYTLARPAAQITVADVLRAIHAPSSQRSDEAQVHAQQICTDALWSELDQHIESHLQAVTLGELIQRQPQALRDAVADAAARPMRGVHAKRTQPGAARKPAANSVFTWAAALGQT